MKAGQMVEGALGFGRLLELEGARAVVQYFDHPGVDGLKRRVEPSAGIRRAVLVPQTRVHWRVGQFWDHGRVIEHDRDEDRVVVRASGRRELLVAESELVVRWRRRLRDATSLLADGWVETRRFHDARHAFVLAYLARESGYRGISAISSAAIEAHAHQIEAVRRVLTDVSPRYLLADEVGLGKTIEAGLLIRQHLLDRRDGSARILVPDALVAQWEEELETKFRLGEQFPDQCSVVAHSRLADQVPWAPVSLLVVDEAHRLSRRADGTYAALKKQADSATAVLLLSATPLLQQPASLLRLLHLLAPHLHRLDDLGSFERALEGRDEIAAFFGNLIETAPPVFLRSAVKGLRGLLAEDQALQSLLDDIEGAMGQEAPAALERAVGRARSHVTEVHRVYNRMIRTRRGVGLAEDFPVLGRELPEEVVVDGSLRHVAKPFTAWLELVQARAEDAATTNESGLDHGAVEVVQALGFAADTLVDAVEARIERVGARSDNDEEVALLAVLADAAQRRSAACPRIATVVDRVAQATGAGKRVAVAAETEAAADAVQAALEPALGRRVLRIGPGFPRAVREFEGADAGAVLVFGPVGEEGQNLQVADLVIHLDLPWDANRLEQRLGRFDRFGAGLPCQHVVLLDDLNSVGNAWYEVLRDGFGVFASSIASLQQAVERLQADLDAATLLGGPEGLRALVSQVGDELQQELSAVELAELLDETVLDERGRELLDAIDSVEGSALTGSWQEAVIRWAAADDAETADLRFHHAERDGQHEFALTRFDNPDGSRIRDRDLPLVPWSDLDERFSGSMPDTRAVGAFRRNTSARRALRLLGPGDPFIDALWDFTEVDDRGRSYALWRARGSWKHEEALLTSFDLRVRPDLRPAIEATGQPAEQVRAALRRRAESYLQPLTERIWLNRGGKPVQNQALLRILAAPYADRRGDQTLRPSMWHRLDVHVPRGSWSRWCEQQQLAAHTALHESADLTSRCRDAVARATADLEEDLARVAARGDQEALVVEQRVGAALIDGLRSPRREVDAAGIVVLSSEPLPDRGAGS